MLYKRITELEDAGCTDSFRLQSLGKLTEKLPSINFVLDDLQAHFKILEEALLNKGERVKQKRRKEDLYCSVGALLCDVNRLLEIVVPNQDLTTICCINLWTKLKEKKTNAC